jgi:probable rRNA maturation factor
MVEINNQTRTAIDLPAVKKAAEKVLKLYKSEGKDLSIAFVGEVTIRRLNKAYRKSDRVTDILSFDGEGDDLGELVICYAKIKRQGPRFGHTPRQELLFILVHGLLHLFGENDDTEKKRLRMIELGEKIIKKLEIK